MELTLNQIGLNKIKKDFEKIIANSKNILLPLISKRDELLKCLNNIIANAYIDYTKGKNEATEGYLDIINFVETEIYPLDQKIVSRLDKMKSKDAFLKTERGKKYFLYFVILGTKKLLFSKENIPLLSDEANFISRYEEIRKNLVFTIEGKNYNLVELFLLLKSSDRSLREKAWNEQQFVLVSNLDRMELILIYLVGNREIQANNVRFDSYKKMKDRELMRSYDSGDIYYEAIINKKIKTPTGYISCLESFILERNEKKKKIMGVDVLKPWDEDYSPYLDNPILVDNQIALVSKSSQVLKNISAEFAEILNALMDERLDIWKEPNKHLVGYNYPIFGKKNLSQIFLNCDGSWSSVINFFHECGHAVHFECSGNQPIMEYALASMEIAELASKTMELFCLEYCENFFPDRKTYLKAKIQMLEFTIINLKYYLMIDQLQIRIFDQFESVSLKVGDIQNIASYIFADFGEDGVDWNEDMEHEKFTWWLLCSHIFARPFYCIEYFNAQLGALELYKVFLRDKKEGLEKYKKFMFLGNSRSMEDIYKSAGLTLKFSSERLEMIIDFVRNELAKLEKEVF